MNSPSPGQRIPLQGMAPLLQVFDMPRSLAFYRDLLGFDVLATNDGALGDDADWVHLRLAGMELMLNTAYEKPHRPDAPERGRMESHADTTLYFGCPDIHLAHLILTGKGVFHRGPFVTGYGWDAIELKDPDGFLVCLHWPRA
jgi:glyoxylase I family protein